MKTKNFISSYLLIAFLCLFYNLANAQCDPCQSGNVDNNQNSLWSSECYQNNNCDIQGNPCQANDVQFKGFYFANSTGGALPDCDSGQVVDLYLWGKFSANATRYAVRTNLEVNIDGVCYEEINECSFDELAVGTSDRLLIGPINISCEDRTKISVSNVWIGWSTSSGSSCTNTTSCGQYPSSKCNQSSILTPTFPLSVDVDWTCGSSVNSIDFSSTISGGTPPYTYNWDFGNGNTSSSENPTETFATNAFDVTLSVTDSKGVVASIDLGLQAASCSFLPVKLLEFYGESNNLNEINLYWSTATESDNKGFALERSRDGLDFEQIGFVNGSGTSTEKKMYNYTDEAPLSGVNYYRLKQVDFGGQFEYSDIIRIDNGEQKLLSVYPNPATEVLYLSDESSFVIYNSMGRAVAEGSGSQVDVSQFSAGIYLLRTTDNGRVIKFIKH